MTTNRRTILRTVGGALGASAVVGSAGTAAAGGSYTNHGYSGFDYWKYVPSGVGPGDPLVVMLHGCSQTADQFREETRMNQLADQEGFAVIYPDQYNARNAYMCWNWFWDANTTRGNGEAAVIAGMTQEAVSDEGLDADRVYVAGLSAGAAMVPNLLVEYADVYAAGAVHSGLEYDAAETSWGGTTAMTYGGPDPQSQGSQAYSAMEGYGITSRVPTVVLQGSADTTVYPVNAHQAAEQATQTNDLVADGVDDDGTDYVADDVTNGSTGGYSYTVSEYHDEAGETVVEKWLIDGMDHAWAGGAPGGEFTAPDAPDASDIVWTFCSGFTN